MLDPKTGSEMVPVYLPDGGERHLHRLWPSDWLRLYNTFRASVKATRTAELREEGATAEAIRQEMQTIDKTPLKYQDVIHFIDRRPEAQYAVVMLSIAKDHPIPPDASRSVQAENLDAIEADFARLNLPIFLWRTIAVPLAGLTFKEEPAKKNADDGPMTPPTSDALPDESGTSSPPLTTP